MFFDQILWDPAKGIDLGFFLLRYYSLMFLVAFLAGWFMMKKIYKREGLSVEKVDSLFMYTVLATLIGARLGHVIFYQPELFVQDPLSIVLPMQFVPEFKFTGFRGLASHGAAIGIILAMYFYSKKVLKKNILWILDRIVLPVTFGGIFVRIGNFMNSEIVGKPTHSDYGVVFVQLGENFPRHPAQLYEAFCYLLVFIVLWLVYWKTEKRKRLGYIFGLFLILLWSVRFFIEFIKKAQVDQRSDWAINTGQWLSVPFILLGVYLMVRASRRAVEKNGNEKNGNQ